MRGRALPEALSQRPARPAHSRGCEATFARASLRPPALTFSLRASIAGHLERASMHPLRLLALSVHAYDGHFRAAGQKGKEGTPAALCMHLLTGRIQFLLQGRAPAGSMGSALGSADGYSAVHGVHSLLNLPVSPPPCLQRILPNGLSSTASQRAGDSWEASSASMRLGHWLSITPASWVPVLLPAGTQVASQI